MKIESIVASIRSSKSRPQARTRRGFSMLELLVVLSIISLMSSIATASFTRILSQWRIDRAAQTLSYDLQMAFAVVGRNRQPVRVKWDPAKVQFTITDRAGTTQFRTRALGLNTEYKLPSSAFTVVVGNGTSSTPNMVEIYPPGLAADSMNIHIIQRTQKRTISMGRGGLVRVLKK